MPSPTGYEEEQGISLLSDDESNYSKVRFDYLRARQVTLSDTLAKTKTIGDVLDSFKNDLKGFNKGSDSNDNEFNNTYNINLNIDKMINSDDKSIEEIAEELALYLRRKKVALGGV